MAIWAHTCGDTALGLDTTSRPLAARTRDPKGAEIRDERPKSGFAVELAENDFLFQGFVDTENAAIVTDAYIEAGRMQTIGSHKYCTFLGKRKRSHRGRATGRGMAGVHGVVGA